MASADSPVLLFLGIFVFIIVFFYILGIIYDAWVISYLMKIFNVNYSSVPFGKIILAGLVFIIIYGIIKIITNHNNKQKSMKSMK